MLFHRTRVQLMDMKKTKTFYRTLFVFILIALLSHSIFSQQPQRENLQDIWLIRSQSLTDDITKDFTFLNSIESALLRARLAETWWESDRARARQWALQAIDIVERVPNKESDAERNFRLSIARAILRILAPKDFKLSQKLVSVFTDESNNAFSNNRDANAKALIEAALLLVPTDPQRATDLGISALQICRHPDFMNLIMNMRPSDAMLADKLLRIALNITKETDDKDWLNAIKYAVFPELINAGFTIAAPSEPFRRELLSIFLDQIQRMEVAQKSKEEICYLVLGHIAPLKNQYANLLPDRVGQLQLTLAKCPSDFSYLSQPKTDNENNNTLLNTIDDLLKAADNAKDKKAKSLLLLRAVQMAFRKKDFTRAIEILDNFDDESRELQKEIWGYVRYTCAVEVAVEKFNRGDMTAMNEVIKAVPDYLQPLAQINLVKKLPKTASRQLIIETLNEAAKGITRSSVSDEEKQEFYFALTQLYAQNEMFAEAADAYKEAIAVLNHREKSSPRKENDKIQYALNYQLPQSFPPLLLDNQEQLIKDAVGSIDSLFIRTVFRLAFLKFEIKQHYVSTKKSSVSSENKQQ